MNKKSLGVMEAILHHRELQKAGHRFNNVETTGTQEDKHHFILNLSKQITILYLQ